MEPILLLQIFLVGFLINLLWEVNHSVLYTTCYEIHLKKYARLITIQSLKDGIWITLFYLIGYFFFREVNIFLDYWQLTLFVILALLFSFIDEKISVKMGRWKYSGEMPTMWGAGVTPFLELAVTGLLTFFMVFYIF